MISPPSQQNAKSNIGFARPHSLRRALRRGLFFVLPVVGLLAVAVSIAGLTMWWLRREFAQVAYDLAQAEARRTAQSVAAMLPRAIRQMTPFLPAEQAIDEALGELTRSQENVLVALIVDTDRRIVFVAQGRNPATTAGVERVLSGLRTVRGLEEQAFIRALQKEVGNLDPVRLAMMREGEVIGWLLVFIDPRPPMRQVEMAMDRMLAQLGPILLVLLCFSSLAVLIIRRQRLAAQRLRVQRDEAERLAHVGALAAGLAHEIRNPVNALMMQIDMLEEDWQEGRPTRDLETRVERIRHGMSFIERTVTDFLNYAMPGQQHPDRIELAPVMEQLADALQTRPGQAPVEVIRRVPAGLAMWSDPHALQQIVSNLLSNAARVQRDSPQPRILVEAWSSGDDVRLRVEDAGPGVAPEHRPHIFECFYTTHSDGTGLGLAISRRLAQLNGGTLELEDSPSPLGGARFVIALPAAREARHAR